MDWGDASGGFINDSIAEEPQQLTNSVSVGGDDKNKAIAAVSVSQVAKLTRPNEGLVLHGKKIYHINLVAMVTEILDKNSQKIHIQVEDGTSGGPLEVNHIIGDTGSPGDDPNLSMFSDHMEEANIEQPRDLDSLKPGDYVRCVGVVKFNQDKSNLVAYNMRIIEDPNEITMHTLEVIRDSMYYERLPATGAQNGGFPPPAPLNTGTSAVGNSDATDDFGRLSTRDKHVLKLLRDRAPREGMKLSEIQENLRAFSLKDIEESLSTLSAEGLCWQGDSEDVWCVNQ